MLDSHLGMRHNCICIIREVMSTKIKTRTAKDKALLEEGIYINPVLRPAAAQNLLRISCTAAHTEKHVEKLISTLVRVAAALGIER